MTRIPSSYCRFTMGCVATESESGNVRLHSSSVASIRLASAQQVRLGPDLSHEEIITYNYIRQSCAYITVVVRSYLILLARSSQ